MHSTSSTTLPYHEKLKELQLTVLAPSDLIQLTRTNRSIIIIGNLEMTTEVHSHDGLGQHSHAGFNAAEHGHSHEILDGPGSYIGREMPLIEGRDWNDRAFTIGIGGYATCHCYMQEDLLLRLL